MIGGTDIFIDTAAGSSGLDCAVRTIRLFWPQAVFEDGRTAELSTRYDQLSFPESKEILIYKNRFSFEQWEQLGADPSLAGTMIHLLDSKGGLALVVDDAPGAEIQKIVHSIRHALKMNSFGTRLQEAA